MALDATHGFAIIPFVQGVWSGRFLCLWDRSNKVLADVDWLIKNTHTHTHTHTHTQTHTHARFKNSVRMFQTNANQGPNMPNHNCYFHPYPFPFPYPLPLETELQGVGAEIFPYEMGQLFEALIRHQKLNFRCLICHQRRKISCKNVKMLHCSAQISLKTMLT